MINVDIAELETRDGRFQAKCREVELTEISRDPEYDACHALTLAGVPDAPVTKPPPLLSDPPVRTSRTVAADSAIGDLTRGE